MLTTREAMEAFIAGWTYSRAVERKVTVSEVHGLKRVTFGTNDLIKRSSHCVLLMPWLSPIQLALNASPISHIPRDFQT